jgi:hypothetical protein
MCIFVMYRLHIDYVGTLLRWTAEIEIAREESAPFDEGLLASYLTVGHIAVVHSWNIRLSREKNQKRSNHSAPLLSIAERTLASHKQRK